MPGTSLAIVTLTFDSTRLDFTAPSVNTAKLTLGAPLTVTAGTPAACSTENGADELVDESLADWAAAAASACWTFWVGVGGGSVTVPPPPPPPQPERAMVNAAAAAVPNLTNMRFIPDS